MFGTLILIRKKQYYLNCDIKYHIQCGRTKVKFTPRINPHYIETVDSSPDKIITTKP